MYNTEYLKASGISKSRKLNEVLDGLTSTLRRNTIIQYIQNLMKKNIPFTMGIIDIDNFKTINDNFGHHVGDLVLRDVATELMKLTYPKAQVGRFGGDEFLIVAPHLQGYDAVHDYAERIFQMVFNRAQQSTLLSEYNVTATMGFASFPQDSDDFDTLFLKMDKALYRGKQKGRNCYIIYVPEKHDKINIFNHTALPEIEEVISYAYHLLTTTEAFDVRMKNFSDFLARTFPISDVELMSEEEFNKLFVGAEMEKQNFLFEVNTRSAFIVNNHTDLKDRYPTLYRYLDDKQTEAHRKIASEMSCMFVKIYAFDKPYGYILFNNRERKKVWQSQEKLSFMFFSKFIGLMLYYEDQMKQ